MQIDTDKLMEEALRSGIREGIKARFSNSYNNPLDKMVDDALAKHRGSFVGQLDECLKVLIDDESFRQEVADAVRKTLAKTLVARFGGELEKQVNTLKSDPATRARITLAIEEIVKQKA